MTKRMLIDATQKEETRVAIVENDHLVDFDYESTLRKPLKGNVFLAKVTRVEPSLQAAFVNYGGNRHGFLPFSEIHPDYFRIPVADREALMAEQDAALQEAEEREAREAEEDARRAAAEESGEDYKSKDDNTDKKDSETSSDESGDNENEEKENKKTSKKRSGGRRKKKEDDTTEDKKLDDSNDVESDDNENDVDGNVAEPDPVDDEDEDEDGTGNKKSEDNDGDDKNNRGNNRRGGRGGRGGRGRGRGKGRGRSNHRQKSSEKYDNMDEETRFRFNLRRKYKIQEVIKRGQVMLIQVNKEERGNKGAAVGSYLSLPGRYCVLMPNSPRAGGISRKIANYKDRNRMREIIKELEVPKGMSVILRTAGVQRTKVEIKRDLDYLIRLWNKIREDTLESSAPALIYEEADLIKRTVRDLYTRDISEIIVAGTEAHRTSKDFMKMLVPSHAKKIKLYDDTSIPLFNKYNAEHQIAAIGETQVTLPSGGYLVINPTEALISVDVNSGRATKERHIEDTALKTNLEAAVEVARQLRLRDLGGLVVIDFIDMENRRNNGKVERKMRDALSGDRARIQVGRISSFGLMEMSRQRMNPSLSETQFEVCDHCNGTGRTRTADATAVMVLRAIEQEGLKGRAAQVIVHVSADVALYILNNKRKALASAEERFEMQILIRVDETVGRAGFRVEVSKPNEGHTRKNNTNNNDKKEGGNNRRGRNNNRRGRRKSEDVANLVEEIQDVEDSNDKDSSTEKPVEQKKPATRRRAGPKKTDDVKVEDKTKTSKEKSDGDKEEKTPVKKTPAKKTVTKKAPTKKADDASNDDVKTEQAKKKPAAKKSAKKAPTKKAAAKKKKDDAPKDYEVVNEAPVKKKTGWWDKLTN